MIRLMVAAPASGSGKTAVACALLRALKERGLNPCAFKCGPDYIDPMFHHAVLGVESRNLDLFLSDEAHAKALFFHACRNHGAAVVEGAMGFYDGVGGTTDRASAWHVADTLNLPVLLVLPARGASLTLAATLRGLADFRKGSHIVGVVLNECSPMLCRTLAPALETETGIPVLGCLPHLDAARIESRHLGLLTAREIEDLDGRLAAVANALEENVDMARLLTLFDGAVPAAEESAAPTAKRCRIAVARDEAFCFTYAETLETFERLGAEPAFFSPLHDAVLPEDIGGLYLPGGYPELYAPRLAENEAMRRAIAAAVRGGLPTVAECGGFLYLGAELCDVTGTAYPMAGVLPGCAADAGKLVRFGYATLTAETDSLLFRAGEAFPIHEFHHWDSTRSGDAFQLKKPVGGRTWRGGYGTETLYAAFPHLYFAGHPMLAERFIAAAAQYGEIHEIM
ncbi:MAG: cobyrinate a,c-diamide synthase [Ruminococcaceae bacterium]|nr:cobyrinate a,c-diamide synthase [Oscillospiraceae bacterium]